MSWRQTLDASHEVSRSGTSVNEYPRFTPVSSEAFRNFSNLPDSYAVNAGAKLMEQGAIPKHVLLLHDGLIRLDYLNQDGRGIMLGLRTSGWYVGAVPIITGVPSLYSVTAITSCSVSSIPTDEFSAKLMGNARLLRHFISTLCGELASQGGVQAHLMSSSAEDRLTCFLQERESKHLRWTTLDPLPLLKQMELAQLLAIKPETLSRMIHKRAAEKSVS